MDIERLSNDSEYRKKKIESNAILCALVGTFGAMFLVVYCLINGVTQIQALKILSSIIAMSLWLGIVTYASPLKIPSDVIKLYMTGIKALVSRCRSSK